MSDMERFSVLLRCTENTDYREIVNEVIEYKERLAVAGEVLMSISKEEREQAIERSRRIAQNDYESDLATMEINLRAAAKEGTKA
jgi:hypothetical protein